MHRYFVLALMMLFFLLCFAPTTSAQQTCDTLRFILNFDTLASNPCDRNPTNYTVSGLNASVSFNTHFTYLLNSAQSNSYGIPSTAITLTVELDLGRTYRVTNLLSQAANFISWSGARPTVMMHERYIALIGVDDMEIIRYSCSYNPFVGFTCPESYNGLDIGGVRYVQFVHRVTVGANNSAFAGYDMYLDDLRVVVDTRPTWNNVRVVFNQPIPTLLGSYGICTRGESTSTRRPCGYRAFMGYNLDIIRRLGRNMTWGEFAALVMYSEGHSSILLGFLNSSNNLQYGDPYDPNNSTGYCYRWQISSSSWVNGSPHCQRPFGLQEHFPHAVVEWILRECAREAGFVDSGNNITYELNGIPYDSECNEEGFMTFLSYVQSLFVDEEFDNGFAISQFRFDPTLYLQRAQEEIIQWGYGAGQLPYGTCPCLWGNVGSETAAQFGNTYNDSRSYSYFFDLNATEPRHQWFKVY